VTRETVGLALLVVSVLALYVWIAGSTAPFGFSKGDSGRYGLIADALRHGHVSLPVQPPRGLLALPDPYDFEANATYRFGWDGAGLHDLSLRNGHLYAYWGPTAALVLFAPLQVIGVSFPESLSVALFGFLGFVFSVAVLRFLVRRFLPATPRWALWVGMVALALGNVVPFVLRRPAEYEVAITCGMCFAFLGLWLLLTGWYGTSRRRWWRLAGGGLALGLALMSRPTLGVVALVPIAMTVSAWRGGGWPGGTARRTVLIAVFGPLVLCGLLTMAYNMARFGSPLEFGQKFQLAGTNQQEHSTFDPAYVPPGVFLYLFAAPRPLILFPFLQLQVTPGVPWGVAEDYTGIEPTGGIVTMMPLLVALVLLPVAARRWDRELRTVVLAMVAAGSTILVGLSLILWGTTQRYEVDFAALFLVSALLVWFTALVHLDRGGWARRLAVVGGVAALATGCFAGLATSFTGYYDALRSNHPGLYHRLESFFSPVSEVEAKVAGKPVIGRIDSAVPAGGPLSLQGGGNWSSFGAGRPTFVLAPVATTVNVVAPRAGRYRLRASMAPGPHAVVGGGTAVLVATSEGQNVVTLDRAGRLDLPMVLKAGINRILLAADAKKKDGPGLAWVSDMTLVDDPDIP